MRYSRSLFIFRRDLRLADNSALAQAISQSKAVLACFIFDDSQIKPHAYFSASAFRFMITCLSQLAEEIAKKGGQLVFLHGKPTEVVDTLIRQQHIEAVFVNRDYTPFSEKRDQALEKICKKNQVDWRSYADLLLTEPEQVTKKEGGYYKKFTPFYRSASQFNIAKPKKIIKAPIYSRQITTRYSLKKAATLSQGACKHPHIQGGRKEAMALLRQAVNHEGYQVERDFPYLHSTSLLSAHLKFGTVSVREVYWALKDAQHTHSEIIKQLYWRDFFTHIAFHWPHVFKGAFNEKYQQLSWINNRTHFKKWCEGKTGFPIVDAGMRELNETGYMHNRVRMIVASFLCKDLLIDWRWGERYFATRLIDYDPSVNNGNWQWAASTGCDAQPYFRIFNPWLQQAKFDANAYYIKQWIPELNAVSSKEIHNLYKAIESPIKDYPRPMVSHKEQAQIALRTYKKA